MISLADSPFRPPYRPKVAVVGAGISGVCAAGHLLLNGADVTIFERANIAGGVWHFTDRIANDPTFPSETPSTGDYTRSGAGEFSQYTPPPDSPRENHQTTSEHASADKEDRLIEIDFAPPGPCYSGLKNNVPTSLMTSILQSWPLGTEEFTSQDNIERYIQTIARVSRVDDVTLYNTRVDDVVKAANQKQWDIRTLTLQLVSGRSKLVERLWRFDAVVIASGHYNLPRVPDTPGLSHWKALFGSRIIHSKQYRNAQAYYGKNVLVIGAGVSALDICKEIHSAGGRAYQSTRGGAFDLPESLLPPGAHRLGEIEAFTTTADLSAGSRLPTESPIPGTILLKDGSVLSDIHQVIVATGYITSYPFLPQYHSDIVSADAAGPNLLVTADGEMLHNLYRDIFYIPDPSLAFVGAPYHIATFSLFDFQGQVVARVFTGKAELPNEKGMRDEYEERVVARPWKVISQSQRFWDGDILR